MKYLFKTISILLLLLSINFAKAQQIPVNNFYLQNSFIFNPAATGNSQNLNAFFDYSNQWLGLKSAPEVGNIGVYGLINNKMGAGFQISQQKHGIFKQTFADFKYSYRITLASNQSLGFGVSLGIQQNKIELSGIENYDANDPALYSNKFNEILLNSGFGLNYNFDKLNVDLSLPIIYGSQENKFGQTLFALANYDIDIVADTWKITPSIFYRYTHKNINLLDINATTTWKDIMWLQLGYRTNGNILSGLGLNYQNINIGYAYEFDRTNLNIASAGTHQIMLRFGIVKTSKSE